MGTANPEGLPARRGSAHGPASKGLLQVGHRHCPEGTWPPCQPHPKPGDRLDRVGLVARAPRQEVRLPGHLHRTLRHLRALTVRPVSTDSRDTEKAVRTPTEVARRAGRAGRCWARGTYVGAPEHGEKPRVPRHQLVLRSTHAQLWEQTKRSRMCTACEAPRCPQPLSSASLRGADTELCGLLGNLRSPPHSKAPRAPVSPRESPEPEDTCTARQMEKVQLRGPGRVCRPPHSGW